MVCRCAVLQDGCAQGCLAPAWAGRYGRKQQAGLIAVGGAGFLVTLAVSQDDELSRFGGRWQPFRLEQNCGVVLDAILLEGGGLRPIRI